MNNNKIKLYTDGACRGNQNSENIGAWGCYIQYRDYEKRISGGENNTTNNIMELKGCIEGLKAIKNRTIPIEVYLDSSYVLNGITNWIDKWKSKNWMTSNKEPVKNKELWIELDELKSKFDSIKFIKVKGHSDNPGNIEADRLCNEYLDKI